MAGRTGGGSKQKKQKAALMWGQLTVQQAELALVLLRSPQTKAAGCLPAWLDALLHNSLCNCFWPPQGESKLSCEAV